MNRRSFLKYMAGATAATAPAAALVTACRSGEAPNRAGSTSMTTRVNPNTGDVVSLLGYGMMRLPQLPEGTPDDPVTGPFDQEMINRQVDYALEHGVNYFDTAPVYCRGLSERCTGIALKRHPRDSYFIATKLSNFGTEQWELEPSKAMFENSLKELQTDYVDYLLLHSTGGGGRDTDGKELSGLDVCQRRFIDNGLTDWLVEQKEKGRIRNLGFSWHGDGISCRSRWTPYHGTTQTRSMAATLMPSNSMTSCKSVAYLPSSWSPCSADVWRASTTTSLPS